MASVQPAQLAYTADGTPYSAAYGDIYHAAAGGLSQARHVFLGGNGLLGENARWRGCRRFVIVETGFGLGLNFLATWQAWRADPQACGELHFVSFELHPLTCADLAAVHSRWPELKELAKQLQRQWPALTEGTHRLHFEGERVVLTIHFGDAAEVLVQQAFNAAADAFFLDGFAPAKNPALWSPRILKALAQLAAPGATLATWTVARAVRQELGNAGFVVTKFPGCGNKREMLRGVLEDAGNACHNPNHQ